MGADPAMIEVRLDAAVAVVEGEDPAGISVEIGVGAAQRAVARDLAGQAVDTAVVIGAAAACVAIAAVAIAIVITIGAHGMVNAGGHIGERTEVIVEGMIFL